MVEPLPSQDTLSGKSSSLLYFICMSSTHERFLEMHHLFRRLLQKNRFVRKLTHTGLSRAEVHTLIEVEADPSLTLGRLVPMFGIDQSTLSRLIKGMVAKSLVDVTTSTSDKRAKQLTITHKGRQAIQTIDSVAGALFHQFAERISQREQNDLATFFTTIADHHKQPQVPARKGEDRLRVEQRRLTRAFGILSPRVFGTSFPASQWHVLSEVCSRSYAPTPSELALLLGMPLNSLSEITRKLEAQGLLRKVFDKSDSRRVHLKATKRGIQQHEQLEATAASHLRDALSKIPTERVERYIDILTRYIGEGEASLNVMNSLPGDLRVRPLESPSELRAARTFAIIESVRLGNVGLLPETIISSNSHVFALEDFHKAEGATKAVLEFTKDKQGFSLTLAAWSNDTAQNTLYSFFVKAHEALSAGRKPAAIQIAYQPVMGLFAKA
jgi:DNA-binding MarR family transcriptional regulator